MLKYTVKYSEFGYCLMKNVLNLKFEYYKFIEYCCTSKNNTFIETEHAKPNWLFKTLKPSFGIK